MNGSFKFQYLTIEVAGRYYALSTTSSRVAPPSTSFAASAAIRAMSPNATASAAWMPLKFHLNIRVLFPKWTNSNKQFTLDVETGYFFKVIAIFLPFSHCFREVFATKNIAYEADSGRYSFRWVDWKSGGYMQRTANKQSEYREVHHFVKWLILGNIWNGYDSNDSFIRKFPH